MAQRQKTAIQLPERPGVDRPAKKRGGRGGRYERHVPTDTTRAQVEALRAYGQNDASICAALGIASVTTLYKHYAEELRRAKAIRHARWAAELEGIAMGRRVNPETGQVEKLDVKPRDRAGVLMFLVETQAGWRRTNRTELSGPNEGPIPIAGPVQGAVIMLPDNGRDPNLRKPAARKEPDGPPAGKSKKRA